jgi:hypothetical protein
MWRAIHGDAGECPGRALTAQDIDAAMRRFKKALIERALGAELTQHQGYALGAAGTEAFLQEVTGEKLDNERWAGSRPRRACSCVPCDGYGTITTLLTPRRCKVLFPKSRTSYVPDAAAAGTTSVVLPLAVPVE